MKIVCRTAHALLCGASLFTVLASFAGAQNQTWIRQFGTLRADYAGAAAIDGAGGVFVSGSTEGSFGSPNAGGDDVWLAHHDGAGNQTWIRQFGTPGQERASAAAADGAGGVFVCGFTTDSLGGPNAGAYDVWLAHHDGAGNQTWTRQFGTIGEDIAHAAAPDGAGGVFVSGHTFGSLGGPNAGFADAWLAHYDSAGNQTWIRQLGTTGYDFGNAAATDGAGGVFVSGIAGGSLGGPYAGAGDAWLAHYDGAGNQTWIRQLGTPDGEGASAAAPDGAGGVFVSGSTTGSLGGPSTGDRDVWLALYDGAGNQTWIRQFGTIDLDYGTATVPDGAGGVFVSGGTEGSLGGQNAGAYDAWLAHYDGAGNQTWIRQLGTTQIDLAAAAAPDCSGGVFVSGSTIGSLGGPSAGAYDVWLAHYGDLTATRYCTPAISNSTGQPGALSATGSNAVVDNDLTVAATQLPPHSFGFFLTSQAQGNVVNSAGSQGTLCLGGNIGRFVAPGQVMNSGANGSITLAVDLNALPTLSGLVAAQPGETWNFQAWHRDANPGPTSNFTDAVSVTFR